MTKKLLIPPTFSTRYVYSFIIVLLTALLFPLFSVPVFSTPPKPPGIHSGLATVRTPHGAIIYAEIADTPQKRRHGLMFRRSMSPDHGMLFRFHELGTWTFWMKNTKMPLDIIWLDKTGHIVDLVHHAPICERKDDFCPRYTPRKKATTVLEVRAGIAKKLGIKRGDTLTITLP